MRLARSLIVPDSSVARSLATGQPDRGEWDDARLLGGAAQLQRETGHLNDQFQTHSMQKPQKGY